MAKDNTFSTKRIEEVARTADVIKRVNNVTNSALGQAKDRLGTISTGKDRL